MDQIKKKHQIHQETLCWHNKFHIHKLNLIDYGQCSFHMHVTYVFIGLNYWTREHTPVSMITDKTGYILPNAKSKYL